MNSGLLISVLNHPGERMMAASAAVGLLVVAFLLWRGKQPRPWAWLLVPTAIVWFGVGAAWIRDVLARAMLPQLPAAVLPGHVAHEHAAAAGAVWFSALLGGALCALAALGLAWKAAPERRVGPGLVVLAAVGIAVVAAWTTTVGLVASAAVCASGALACAVPERPVASTLGAVAVVLGVVSAVAGAEWALADALSLFVLDHDLPRMIPALHARTAVAALALLALGGGAPAAIRSRSPAAAILALGLIGLVVGWGTAWSLSSSWGPAPQLAGLAHGAGADAPVHRPEEGWRFVGGCVWSRDADGWTKERWGRLSARHLLVDCAAGDAPRAEDRPVLLLGKDMPALWLLAPSGVGDVGVLVRLHTEPGPASVEPWRWATEPMFLAEPGTTPLATVVVADRGPGVVVPEALDQARFDVVIVPGGDMTVGDALSACAKIRGDRAGVRCLIGRGSPEDWDASG